MDTNPLHSLPSEPTWYDLSYPLSDQIAAWPGDPPFVLNQTVSNTSERYCRVSSFGCSSHFGTHLDCPGHVDAEGGGPLAVPWSTLIGPARVVSLEDLLSQALPEVFWNQIKRFGKLLIRTGYQLEQAFQPDYPVLPLDMAHQLVCCQLHLLGLDTPSVDPYGCHELPRHDLFLQQPTYLLESLQLNQLPIEVEVVWLNCLPLALASADAAPCRVIACPIEQPDR